MIHYFEKYKNDERVPLALLVLMGLLTIFYIVSWIGDFYIRLPQQSNQIIHAVQPLTSISQSHVFGSYNDSLQNIPETSLQLTLEGIMLDLNDEAHSYVIISTPSTPASVYKLGDMLPGGAQLKRILQQQIVINYQGEDQAVSLPVDQL